MTGPVKSWRPFRTVSLADDNFMHPRKLGWTFAIFEFYFAAMQFTHSFRNHFSMMTGLLLAVLGTTAIPLPAQTTNSATAGSVSNAPAAVPILQIKADQTIAKVSPTLYGLMTEEINFSYEGGLYGELIRNRTFKANPTNAAYWNAVGGAAIALDTNQPLNSALNVSLRLDTCKASKKSPTGIANGGYWGIPVKPNTTYHVSFYARGEHFSGPLTVSLVHVNTNEIITYHSKDGSVTKGVPPEAAVPGASATIRKISGKWQKYEVTLATGNVEVPKDNQLVITTTKPGTFWNHHGTVWFH